MLDRQAVHRRSHVHRIPWQRRIDSRVEGDIETRLGESIVDVEERNPLPTAGCSGLQRRSDRALGPHPDPGPIVVLVVEGIGAPADRSARHDAIDRFVRDGLVQLDSGFLFSAPGERERQTDLPAGNIRTREPHAIGEAVSVFTAEERQKHQPEAAAADHTRRTIRIAGPFDVDRAFVNDDHDQHLGGIGDRREALQDFDVLEPLRRTQPRGHLGEGCLGYARTDVNAGQPPDLVVAGDGVAVDLNGGDCFLFDGGPAGAGRYRECQDECRAHRCLPGECRELKSPPRRTRRTGGKILSALRI